MSKIDLDTISSGYQSTANLNDNFQSIEDELNDKVLYRDPPSGEPNAMQADLDMNSQRMINLPSATTNNEPATYGQLLAAQSGTLSVTTLVEEQAATSDGQSVFTLTGITYTPGANNIVITRNGSTIPPSLYTQTSTTVVTLNASLADQVESGDNFVFWVNSRDTATDTVLASNVTYDPAGTGSVNTDVQTKLREFISVKDFGVVGDGVNNDTSGIQAAIDYVESLGGGTVYFPEGDYRVSVTKGTNDKYGLRIDSDKVRLFGDNGARLRRLSSNISTYALSFPILLIGSPDSNSTQVSDIVIEGLEFYGEDTRHSTSGAALMDGRQAVWVKNGKGVKFTKCRFLNIDSSAIWCQKPGEFDYENSAYYNTTKCYNISIDNCNFIAASHSTNGRALLHAIVANSDNVRVVNNYFEWCDDCLSCSTTYDDYDDVETDTYTDTNLSASVNRTGRGYVVKGNTCYNSSEHAFYLEAMGITCTGNSIFVDNQTVCNTTQFQIRGRGVVVSDNSFTGVARAAGINTGAMDVTFKGNSIQATGDNAGGIINIQSQGLTSYIDNRSDFFGSYKPMKNIVVSGNTIDMPDAAQTNGVALRLYTDTSDANFPDGQMNNVVISSNVFNRPRKAILNIANMAKRVRISDNVFNGKDFTEAGFTTGTTMNSEYVLGIDDSLTAAFTQVAFDNNTVYGFEYILFDDGGAGASITAPYGIRGNRMDYIKYWDTSAFNQPVIENMMTHNTGTFFLDRTGWSGTASIQNSLYDGTNANSDRRNCILIVGAADVRAYYDDAGSFKAL